MDLKLTASEREEMTKTFGNSRASEIITLAETKLEKAPKGELTGPADPGAIGSGRFYSQIDDPRTSNIKRLTITDMQKLAMDPQVALGVEMHRLPILTLRPEFQHIDPEVAAFLNHELERVGWVNLARDVLTALEYGFFAAERVYTYRDTTITSNGVNIKRSMAVYQKLKGIHPNAVQLETDAMTGEWNGFTQMAGGKASVPENKSFIFSHQLEFGNRYGNPITRRAYKYWWWGELVYQFANRYHEDQAVPPRKVFYEPSQSPVNPLDPLSPVTDVNKNVALDIAEKSRAGSGLAFPLQTENTAEGGQRYSKGWDMEYLVGPNKATEFTTYLDHLDAKKLRALFVPEKLAQSSSGGGSYAMVESLAEFFLMSEEALAAQLYQFMITDWARPLINYNFGSSVPDATLPNPKLSRDNRKFLQDFLTSVLASNSAVLEVDVENMARELGVPLKENHANDVIEQQTPENSNAPNPNALQPSVQARGRGVDAFMQQMNDIPGVRKAVNNKAWESATKQFQTSLGEAYNGWKARTAALLENVATGDRDAILQMALLELRALLVKRYRASIPDARGLGYGDEISPASLTKLAKKLEVLETGLASRIANIGVKVTRDLSELGGVNASDIADVLALRLKGSIIQPAGNDYWHTIVDGWTDKRREREADPTVQQGKLRWVLDPLVQNHCDDCMRLEGEYDSIDELPSIPGDGSTECNIYCFCWLEEQDEKGNWQRRISDL